jgi:hypothetical protein
METFALKKETVNGILSYLGSRPYVEVAALIGRIREDVEHLNGKENGDKGTDSGE